MKLLPTVAVLLASAFADTRYGRFWPDDMTTTPDDDSGNTDVPVGNGTRSNDDLLTTTAAGSTLVNEILGGGTGGVGESEQMVESRPDDQSQTSSTTTSTTTSTTPNPITSPLPQRRTTYHMMAGVLGAPGSRSAKNTASGPQRGPHIPVPVAMPLPMASGAAAIMSRGNGGGMANIVGGAAAAAASARNKTALDLQTSLRSGGGFGQGPSHYVSNAQGQILGVATNRTGAIHVGRTQSLVTHHPNSKKYYNDLEYRL